MPYTASDHQETKVIELSSFIGGINSGVPPTQIADNECVDIQNMFMDRVSGRLRTRYPVLVHSNSAVPAAIYNMHYWKSTWILATTDRKVYYLDSSLDPQYLGDLSGTDRPCFCAFNNKLAVASGGVLQYIAMSGTTPQALADAPGAPDCKYVIERYSRLVTAGEASYPDRIVESNYFTESTWTATDYADIGYLDDTTVIGITEAFEGMYIIFKRGSGGLKTYYATSLSATAPTSTLATNGHAPRSHFGVIHALGRVFLMEQHYVSCLVGTDAQGKIIYDQTPGLKLSNSFNATANCHAAIYPRDAQIWFVPDPAMSQIYVYHYHLNAWTRFTFGSRKIYSMYYDPVADYMYLGCDDGYVYKYDYTSMVYADTGGSYTSRYITKMFAQGNREMVLKAPRLLWTSLKAGSGTLKVKTAYGQTSTTWGTITTSQPQDYVYDSVTLDTADFTGYTEVDVPGRVTVSATSLAVANCTQQESVYVYEDFTAAYFSSDFEFRTTVNMASTSVTGGVAGSVVCFALSNEVSDTYTTAVTNDGNALYVSATIVFDTSVTFSLTEIYPGAGSETASTSTAFSMDTNYTVRVLRLSQHGTYGTTYMFIYNSSGTLLETESITSQAAVSYRYLYPFSTWKSDSSGRQIDLTISNFGIEDGNYVYDTQTGGSNESYVWPETYYEEQKGDYNQPTESFQFDVALTSGGFMIERLVAEISASRRT